MVQITADVVEEVRLEEWKKQLVRYYVERQAAARGNFTLTSGRPSDFYVDGRAITTFPPALRIIVAKMKEIFEQHHLLPPNANLVAPVLSAVPIATILAMDYDIPFIIDRVTKKSHGMAKRFEGHFTNSDYCLVIDDTITFGTTVIKTIDGLLELGKTVTDVVIAVDREEGGREELAAKGIRLHNIITKRDLIAGLDGTL